MSDENARVLANLFCLMQGTNKAFAKYYFGVWLYKDGIVVHNLQAIDSEANGHVALCRKKLEAENIHVREYSRCDCGQCWVLLLDGDRGQAGTARNLVWESAFECVGLPSVPPNTLEYGIEPPDFPTIRAHVDFIKSLQKHGLIKCSRMVKEGQRRTKVT